MADEQVKKYIDKAKNEMESSVVFLDESLAHIRAGKANTKILDGIKVDYYGTPTPLTSVATVTTPDAKTISIQPWEKGLIPTIEKAILASDVGITPANNGEIVRLAIPPLTEERRRQLQPAHRGAPETGRQQRTLRPLPLKWHLLHPMRGRRLPPYHADA